MYILGILLQRAYRGNNNADNGAANSNSNNPNNDNNNRGWLAVQLKISSLIRDEVTR